MTVQTAVLIETLTALGAEIRWASCNIYSTQDEAAAAVVVGPNGTPRTRRAPVFAWKGETSRSTGVHRRHPHLARWRGPNMILDDGGDATMLVHKGREWSRPDEVPPPTRRTRGVRCLQGPVRRTARREPDESGPRSPRASRASPRRPRPASTGSTRAKSGSCSSRRSTSTTRSPSPKFDNKYGCRHSVVDGLNRATDVLIAGKTAVVAGYGDVGKGCAAALAGPGRARRRHRGRPDLRAPGRDGGFQVVPWTRRRRVRRHFHHDDRLLRRHHRRAHGADEEQGDRPTSATSTTRSTWPAWRRRRHREDRDQAAGPRMDPSRRPLDHRAVRRPPDESGQRDRPPELRDVELLLEPDDRPDRGSSPRPRTTSTRTASRRSRPCPKHLDEKVARAHLEALGVNSPS